MSDITVSEYMTYLFSRYVIYPVPVAQWLAHLTSNQEAVGSSPTRDTQVFLIFVIFLFEKENSLF